MRVDADSLEQLNLRTRDGSQQAGRAFSHLVDDETRPGATTITLESREDLLAQIRSSGEEFIECSLSGGLSGTVVLAFDGPACTLLAERGATGTADSSSLAVGRTVIDAFVTEWEDYVGDSLTVGEPTSVSDLETYELDFEAITDATESAPVFQGEIHRVGAPGRVTLFLVPDAASMRALLGVESGTEPDESTAEFGMGDAGFDDSNDAPMSSGSGLFADAEDETTPIPLDKLSVFSDLTRAGTTTAAERITQMTGIETETEVSGINFRPIDDVSSQLYADSFVGTTTEFVGAPSGHLVIMFPTESAQRIAETMLPLEPDGDGLTAMHESAIEELGNIMTSGFIDGWANVLQTSVDHTPPVFTDDIEMTMLELVTEQLGPFQTHAYTIESRITTESIAFDCAIHALPNESQLSDALEELLLARTDRTEADPGELF